MNRVFFSAEAQARYTDDQFAGLAKLAALANDYEVAAVVVAGDVFDDVIPDRRIVNRTVEALKQFDVPVFLLPGNHDPSSPESVWLNSSLSAKLPANVIVMDESSVGVLCEGRLEIVGAPWTSKRPDRDLVAERLSALEATGASTVRVLVGHGGVDAINPDPGNLNLIRLSEVEDAIQKGFIHYLALGDRHSALPIGNSGRIWYSGASLMTNFREDFATTNRALIVELEPEFTVREIEIGEWEFRRVEISASGRDLVRAVKSEIDRTGDRGRRAVRFVLEGTVSLAERAEIDQLIDEAGDLYGSIGLSKRSGNLAVVADDEDLEKLHLGGYGDAAVAELVEMSRNGGEEAEDALLALRTLFRLIEGVS